MNDYITSVIAVSILSALATLLTYGGGAERAVRAAIGMILLYTVCMPVVSFVAELSPDGLLSELDVSSEIREIDGEEYYGAAEDAFLRGIALAVADEFRVDAENVEVRCIGFDLSRMRAEVIRVRLTGGAALSDSRRVKEYIEDSGLGRCEVSIGFD